MINEDTILAELKLLGGRLEKIEVTLSELAGKKRQRSESKK
jgi:hypothetical protein